MNVDSRKGLNGLCPCRPGIPHACLEGLQGYSHCWIIYIFHRNTDLQDLWRGDDRGLKAKVQVPKLNGQRVGVFATRTPHRPNPVGQYLPAST
jgi:tRNA (Thr-GGU) A37 N-methylase